MQNIEERLSKEAISKKQTDLLRKNIQVVRKIQPICDSLKRENLKTRSFYSIYAMKLDRVSSKLQEIELRNTELQTLINNKTAVFELLRDIAVNSEINDEHFSIFGSADFSTSEGLVRIEQALLGCEEHQFEDMDLRIIRERSFETQNALKLFFRRFRLFFEEFLSHLEDASDGKLKVHSSEYEEIRRFEFIFKFAFYNYKEDFISISSMYSRHAKDVYYKEVERHMSILQKLFSDKKAAKISDGVGIFMESFFMVVKCEVYFCKTKLFFGDDVTEFVSDIFRDVFNVIMVVFQSLYKAQGLNLICALGSEFAFEFQSDERDIWLLFVEKIKKQREQMKKDFLNREKDDLSARSRLKNLDRCLEHIKVCNDLEITEKLVEMTAADIMRGNKEELEDVIHTLRLLYKLNSSLKDRQDLDTTVKEVNEVIWSRLKDFEKEGMGYVFGGDNSKVTKRIKNVLSLIDNENNILAFFKNMVFENASDEQKRELQVLF